MDLHKTNLENHIKTMNEISDIKILHSSDKYFKSSVSLDPIELIDLLIGVNTNTIKKIQIINLKTKEQLEFNAKKFIKTLKRTRFAANRTQVAIFDYESLCEQTINFTVELSRASIKDPENSFTIRTSQLPELYRQLITNGKTYEIQFMNGEKFNLKASRHGQTLYTGKLNNKPRISVPQKCGIKYVYKVINFKEITK